MATPFDMVDFPLGPKPMAYDSNANEGGGLLMNAVRKHSTGSRALGIISEVLAGLGGGSSGYTQGLMREKEQDRQYQQGLMQRQLALADHQRERAEGNQDWQTRQDYEAAHRADPPAVAIAKIAGLQPGTPEWQAALTAAIPGYGYTAPVLQAKTEAQKSIAGYRADRSAGLKAQPTYAQSHPKASGGGGKPAKLPTGFILD